MKLLTFILLLTFLPAGAFAVDLDSDLDGLFDTYELQIGTDPNNTDTDGDGYFDGSELAHDYSPFLGGGKKLNESDRDGDRLNDWLELRWFKTSSVETDSDKDGFSDFDEVMGGQSPVSTSTNRVFSRDIVVDRTSQTLAYNVDSVTILRLPVSTGNPKTPTPAGTFAIDYKVEKKHYIGPGYNLPGAMWNMRFKTAGGYYIHGAYWHNDFGKRTRSHGCVNMKTEDAGLIYKYIDVGFPVTVTGTTPVRMIVGK